MQGSTSKLPVSAIFLGMLAGVIGGVLASALHVSSREGEAGYFVVFIALIVILLAAPVSILLTLYWRGVRKIWLLVGCLASSFGILAVGAAGFGIWYMAQPHFLNANGPTPQLEFEVKPADGMSVETLANVEAELDTDRNTMPANWRKEEGNSGVRAGAVELYYRTSQRLFVLKFPDHEDRIFKLGIPANPMKPKYRQWSNWQKPTFVAKGESQPTRPSGGPDCQIRYRVDYQQ